MSNNGRADASKKRKPSSVTEADKIYACTHPGCRKSFIRSDHLARHRLNHEPGQIFACDRCSRTFVRPDLLKRHAERHDKREQSGLNSQPTPGRIKGSTKKKPSQASAGSSIVPAVQGGASASTSGGEYPSSGPNSEPNSVGSRTIPLPSPTIIDDYDHDRYTDLLAPRLRGSPSPESSANLLLDFSHLTDQMNFSNLLDGTNDVRSMHSGGDQQSTFAADSADRAASPPEPPPPPAPPTRTPIYHFPSGPVQDSAMSAGPSNFNAGFDFDATYGVASSNYDTPFLSASESNWLFNHADSQHGVPLPEAASSSASMTASAPGPTPLMPSSLPDPMHTQNQNTDSKVSMRHLRGMSLPPGSNQNLPLTDLRNGSTSHYPIRDHNLSTIPTSASSPSRLGSMLNPAQQRRCRHVHFADAQAFQQRLSEEQAASDSEFHPPLAPSFLSSHHQSHPNQTLGADHGQAPAPRVIRIGLATRNRLAKHLASVPNLLSDNRFSPERLDENLARFFEWDACHYSTIHRATFEPDEAPNHLLASMIAIGAYFTGPEAHALAEEVHKCNLQSMLSSSSFCARADMQTIQATLFLNVFGRLMSTYDDHEQAHILYPAFLTMYRRSALFNTPHSPVPPGADIHTRWVAWREEESSKRAAFMAYQFDIVCNTMFRHTGTLSAFQVQLTLPCNEDEWYAPSPVEWYRIHSSRVEPPPFLITMKAFLMPGLNSPEMSPLARVICLHGLLSVAFDMQWRENFLLGLSTHPDGLVKDWRPTLTSAYNCWKTRFDAALTQAPTAFGTQLLRNSIPIYAIAHVTLAVDVDELQIFAGKRRALGLPVPASVVDTTRRRIISWSGLRGREAVWHAAHFVRSSMLTRRPYEVASVHSMVLSWCLYLSCLCVHAYSTAVSLTQEPPESLNEADPGDAMAYLETICSSSPGAIKLPDVGTAASVCKAVSRILKENVNWELAQEASQLLNKIAHEGS